MKRIIVAGLLAMFPLSAAAEVICLKADGKTPEPCESRQPYGRIPPAAPPKQDSPGWAVLPPPEYDKPFTGKLTEIRVPPETMRAICPKTPLPLTLACTYPTRDQSECLIIMVSDEIIRGYGWDPVVVRMHEESHCGGWPAHHPGIRAATPELVEKWLAAKARVKISER
jgi:hypothetical protein